MFSNNNLPYILALGFVCLISIVGYLKRAQLKRWTGQVEPFFIPNQSASGHTLWPIFLVSFGTLFIELAMIRWIGTEVRIFAYFQNLALIACFLGFGLGCYLASKPKNWVLGATSIALLIALVQVPIRPWQKFLTQLSNTLGLSSDANLWGVIWFRPETSGILLFAASAVVVACFLILLVLMMIPFGQSIGHYLDKAPNPISAYSVNLLGSIAGIWTIAALAFLSLPPAYWFALGFGLLLLIQPRSWRYAALVLVLLAGSLVFLRYPDTATEQTHWSPYQKLRVVNRGDQQYSIQVNNTGYMQVANATPEFLARNPEIEQRFRKEGAYDSPYNFTKSRERVLILGAGGGNDAAAALRNGVNQVVAVEIDPVILSLGERLHPEHPYSSPKVQKVVNDARAFLRQEHEKFDVIIFALLDSHTNFSDFSNMRLDNYVFTEEAFREARRLLKPDGVLIVRFMVWPPWEWIGQRFNVMLTNIFDRPPVVYMAPPIGRFSPGTVFITSDDPDLWVRAARPELAAMMAANPPNFTLSLADAPRKTTDDWPYVYHRSPSIPRTYVTISLILLALAFFMVRGTFDPRQVNVWQFFFLGAGFLLLETQLISRLALYFGTTWIVNCLAITAILFMLVLSNIYVARWRPKNLLVHYLLLVICLLTNYFVPWHQLPYSAQTVGVLLSIAYSFPLFFAGVVFTEMFRQSTNKANAFGANIVGAVAGGLAQNLSFIVGMEALLLLAALFYGSAALFGALTLRKPAALSTSPLQG